MLRCAWCDTPGGAPALRVRVDSERGFTGMKIAISAGEVSGDQHLARVVLALKAHDPSVEVRGMAGAACRAAGAELLIDCYRSGAAMGFSELLRSWRGIWSSFATLKDLLRSWRPDLLVLVDYPDFNLRLARAARAVGVPVLYFIPPKVWAWRPGRVRAIAAAVDRVAAIFPFEPEFYQKHGYSAVTYVGHPLGDRATECAAALARGTERSLLLLPGSRRFEVERILPPLLRVFTALRTRHPDLRARVVLAPTICSEWAQQLARTALGDGASAAVEWSHAEPLAEMLRAHTGILKSGTCNLEGAMAGLPFVSVYSGSWFSKIIVDLLVSLREYSPVNILRRGTVKEFMQVRIDEPALTAAVDELLTEGPTRQQVQSGLAEVRAALLNADPVGDDGALGCGQPSVAERVARLAYEMAARGVQGRKS